MTGYEVFVDGVSKATTTGATSVNLTGLTQGTYAVTVKAKDAAGNVSAASGAYSLVIPAAPDTTAPTAPGTPSFTNVTTTSATVNWAASTDNVGVAGYQVFLNGSTTPAATTTGATTVNLTGLTPSTTYSVTVKARDAAGNVSAASAAGPLTTATPPDTTAPTAPGTPTFASITGTGAAVSWSASTDNVGVTGYEVYLNGAATPAATTTGATTVNLTGLTTAPLLGDRQGQGCRRQRVGSLGCWHAEDARYGRSERADRRRCHQRHAHQRDDQLDRLDRQRRRDGLRGLLNGAATPVAHHGGDDRQPHGSLAADDLRGDGEGKDAAGNVSAASGPSRW